jgi:hypothetical protein
LRQEARAGRDSGSFLEVSREIARVRVPQAASHFLDTEVPTLQERSRLFHSRFQQHLAKGLAGVFLQELLEVPPRRPCSARNGRQEKRMLGTVRPDVGERIDHARVRGVLALPQSTCSFANDAEDVTKRRSEVGIAEGIRQRVENDWSVARGDGSYPPPEVHDEHGSEQ